MRILVDELPALPSDCPFFYMGECSIDRCVCMPYKIQVEIGEVCECPYLKEYGKGGAE